MGIVGLDSQWSGTFISWAITTAFGKDKFPVNPKHVNYANAIRRGGYPFTALNPRTTTPIVGDIIINTRFDSSSGQSTVGKLSFNTNPWDGVSHGDVVMSVGMGKVIVTGGNKGKTGGRVLTVDVPLTNGLLPSRYFVILRPNANLDIPGLVALLRAESAIWTSNGWTHFNPATDPYLNKYWNATGNTFQRGNASDIIATSGVSTGGRGVGSSISPYIASIESFHPHIQYELIRRLQAPETANTYLPYVKLTSLVWVMGENVINGKPGEKAGFCPTLGIHGQTNANFEEIFNPAEDRSIVGYATNMAGSNFVPVVVDNPDEDPQNIPTPGIVSITTERGTAGPMGVRGGLFRGTLNIRAYSLGQVNALLKYFVRPATRVVLELGRESSSEMEELLTQGDTFATVRKDGPQNNQNYTQQLFKKFDWKRPKEQIDSELSPLVKLEKGQRDFIQRYIYNNFGNYEIFIGYVVSFKLKYTKEGIYEIELLIHSVQQFEVPTKLSGTQPLNTQSVPSACKTIELADYFNKDGMLRPNSFKKLISKVTTPGDELNARWANHVVPLIGQGANPGDSGAKQPGYLVSWQFFVDVILNDEVNGLLSVYQLSSASDTMKLLRTSVLRPVGTPSVNPNSSTHQSSMYAYEVSWNRILRSTDPGTLVIYNYEAQRERYANYSPFQGSTSPFRPTPQTTGDGDLLTNLRKSPFSLGVGNIDYLADIPGVRRSVDPNVAAARQTKAITDLPEDERRRVTEGTYNFTVINKIESNREVGSFSSTNGATSFLTNGVWLNSNAIAEAFTGADTMTSAIGRLLNAMNNATQGYWNLQILSTETPDNPGMYVIDMGLSKPNTQEPIPITEEGGVGVVSLTDLTNGDGQNAFTTAVNNFKTDDGRPKYLYVFNQEVDLNTEGVGSELLDLTVDSNLPQVIAVQAIAGVGGIAQRGSLNAIDVPELKRLNLYDVFPKDSDQVGRNDLCAKSDGTPRTASDFIDELELSALTKAAAKEIQKNLAEIASTTDTSRKLYLEQQINYLASASVYEGTPEYQKEWTVNDITPKYQQKPPAPETGDLITTQLAPYPSVPPTITQEAAVTDNKYNFAFDPEYRAGMGYKPLPPPNARRVASVQEEIDRLKTISNEVLEANAPNLVSVIRDFAPEFGQAFALCEYDISTLVKKLDVPGDERNNPTKIHPFNSSNLTKTTVNLKLPGIGGVQLFQSFGVARVPNILNRGYYVVTKVSHDFSIESGWVTNIEGRFRYKPQTRGR